MKSRRHLTSVIGGSSLFFLAFLAIPPGSLAATITKKNSTNDLNRKQSWIGNKTPTSSDIALWDSTVLGANTTLLGGNVSWQGIRITNPGGLVTISAGNTLTLGTSGIDMSSATVNFTLNCAVSLGALQTWNVNSGRTLLASGTISGSGGITKSGLGTLTLGAVNSYTGATTISAGTLSVASAGALGMGSAVLIINPTGIFQATGSFSSARMISLGGTGGAASGGILDVTGSSVETRTGVISGAGSLTKIGTGTLTLLAANTYLGDTFINGGILSIGNNQALGALPPSLGSALYAVHLASGTTLQSTVSSTGDNRQLQLIGGSATLDLTSGISRQNNGLVYGPGGLIKTGAGTEILTNANTYSGGTTVNAGTLQINNASGSGTGTGAVTINGGAILSGLPTATGFVAPGSISGTVTVNNLGSLLARSGGTFTFGGLTLNAGAIANFQIGAPTSTAVLNITGVDALSLAGNTVVNISNAGGLAAGTYHLFNYTGAALANITNLQLGSTPGAGFTYSLSNNQFNTSIDLLVSTSNQQWANDADGNWNVASNWTNATTPNSTGAQANFFGVINQARTVTVNGAYTAGSITFNAANSYTIAGDGAGGHGITLSNSGVADVSVQAGSHTISAPLALTDNLDIQASNGTALNISSLISENSSGRTVLNDGAGSVTFSGTSANTYTGLTTISAGTLNLNKTAGINAIGTGGLQVDLAGTASLLASNQIADTASVMVTGTFSLGTFSETIAALNGGGSVVTGAGSVLTVGAANNLDSTFDGVISGAGTITKAGAGTFTLTGANTFGGAGQTVSINAGTLKVGADTNFGDSANTITFNGGALSLSGSLTSSRNITLSSSATIDTGNSDAVLSGVMSGSGGLTKMGNGKMTLSGVNTYTGGSSINAGTVAINSSASLGAPSSSVTINAGTLEATTSFTTTRNIALGNSASSIQVNSYQTYTVNGVLSGSGALNKTGAGTLALGGINTFTGATAINNGTVLLAASGNALNATSSITVSNGGMLVLGASDQINNAVPIILDGGTFARGNFSEGTTNSAGLGSLTLTSDSHVDFGIGTVGILTFATFDPGPDALTLTVDNWTGTPNTVGGASTDRLIFNSSQLANLSSFAFTGYSGATQFNLGNGFYEVTPLDIPEPEHFFAAAVAVGGILFGYLRKREAAKAQK